MLSAPMCRAGHHSQTSQHLCSGSKPTNEPTEHVKCKRTKSKISMFGLSLTLGLGFSLGFGFGSCSRPFGIFGNSNPSPAGARLLRNSLWQERTCPRFQAQSLHCPQAPDTKKQTGHTKKQTPEMREKEKQRTGHGLNNQCLSKGQSACSREDRF